MSFNWIFLERHHILSPKVWSKHLRIGSKKCSDSYIFCIPVIHRIDNAPNSLCPRCKELFNFKCNLVSLILPYESAMLIPHIVATDSRALSALTSPNLYHILIYTLSLLVAFLVSSFTDILNLGFMPKIIKKSAANLPSPHVFGFVPKRLVVPADLDD